MTLEEAREKLTALQQKMAAYNHATALIYYDGVTAAPRGTAENRAQTLAVLSGEMYKLATGPETVELLEFLDEHKAELSEREQRMVYLLLKDIREMQKIPMDEYVGYQRLLSEADDVWHRAKETSDFELFRPVLEKIFETNIRFAGWCAPDKAPYDYWLDKYEEGISMASCDAFFAALRERIVPLLKRVQAAPQVDNGILKGSFSAAKQDILSHRLMEVIGLDPEHVALSTTEHPFTISFGSHLDERITTHYYEEDFSYSMYSVIHEGGHALYDTGSDDALAWTVLDGGVSMGIHESQSRFYENILGRSKGFTGFVLPEIRKLFPEAMKDVEPDQFYKAINRCQPSLIRTEADEVTYCLHVMIRYELEKRVMAGDLEVKDLPAEWNRLYREYLGLDVPDDKRGVLQDSHWSGGMIGYFPSYALGSAYGAQFLHKMKETTDVDKCLAEGNFAPINEWNRSHIWQYGSLYTPAQLLDRVFGEPFDPNYYMEYLENKYREIYNL